MSSEYIGLAIVYFGISTMVIWVVASKPLNYGWEESIAWFFFWPILLSIQVAKGFIKELLRLLTEWN